MSYYQNQPLDLSCHKNRALSPAPPLAFAATVHERTHLNLPPTPPAATAISPSGARCFRRRHASSSDNDDEDDQHPSPDSALDASREARRRSLGSSDEPFTDRSRSRSPVGGDEEDEAAEERRRNFGYDIGPRKRFLSKFFTSPQGELSKHYLVEKTLIVSTELFEAILNSNRNLTPSFI
jgi:hypothetical protein